MTISLVFLETSCNDSLQQSIASSSGKTREKISWGSDLDQNGPKSGSKLVVFPFS